MLTTTPKLGKNLKKVKKKWSHEMKCATTNIKMKFAKMRAKPKTIGTADINITTKLP